MSQASQEPGSISKAAAAAMHAVTDKAKELASSAGEFVGHAKDKVQEWAHSASDKMKEAAAATGDAAVHAKDKVQEWAHSASDKMKEVAAATGDAAVHAKDKAQEFASAAAHNAGDAIQSAGHEITSVIRRYPVQSVLVGAALGYLLAKATSKG